MKDLIEKILAYLPQYLADFGALISGPKRFIAQKNTVAEDTFVQSLLFLGISLVVVVIMTASLLTSGNGLWTYLATFAVVSLLAVSLCAVALRIAWRLVGGKAAVRCFFVAYAYFFGLCAVIFAFFWLLGEGVFKVLDPAPALYAKAIEAKLKLLPLPHSSGNWVPVISFLLKILGFFFFAGAWGFLAWGAYRELNGLSKVRSFVAFVIMGVFDLPIVVIVCLVGSAMINGK